MARARQPKTATTSGMRSAVMEGSSRWVQSGKSIDQTATTANKKQSERSVWGKQLKSRWKIGSLREWVELPWNLLPVLTSKEAAVAEVELTPEPEAAAQRLAEIIAQKAKEEALVMARLLVSKKDHELLGATEFEIRDRVHRLGAHAIETAVNQRKKGGTKGRA